MTDVRTIAYNALLMVEDGRAANSLASDVLDKYSYLDGVDRAFLKRLIEGTIERRISIDYILDQYSKVPAAKMKKMVRTLLRLGTYQLIYMDAVADHAAVSETVKIAKKTKVRALSGYINAVLRKISAERDNIVWPSENDPVKYLSVKYSCPEWIVDKLINEQGRENALTVLELSVSVRPVAARVNISKGTAEEALGLCHGRPSEVMENAIVLTEYDNIADIPAVKEGRICVQDISSMLVCALAGIKKDHTVLDVCASPGGKTVHAADLAASGKVIACDVSQKKIDRIRENADRCGFSNIETRICDSSVFSDSFAEYADVVIADVPCSGLGVMGRKNDIKYNLTQSSIDDLVVLQRKILENASRYVKPGGILMFSTCTVSLTENQENMRFLTEECGLCPVDFYDELPLKLKDDSARSGYIQLYGDGGATDGFFIGKLVKRT
ncbi:MAG: 16S rRNA (cytosine(967)-C(5))-methyltransferase RsmB [Lachnospiraceae bacterium]|nr:16S rRNA (cytosine(967)-C(5))-methyltransferase RsmB [Lachnospiraceae bacterium]